MSSGTRSISASTFRSQREDLLKQEKQATRLLASIATQCRALPRVKLSNPQQFKFTAPDGRAVTFPDAFEHRQQLILYHLMPTVSKEGILSCPGCTFAMDHIPHGAALKHLHSRNTTFIAAAPVSADTISKTVKRMGWTFPLYSSHGLFDSADANGEDVSWRPIEGAFALEVFFKDDDGTIFHTYETQSRGVESLLGTYALLDLTILRRQDEGSGFRLHDKYA